MNRQANVLPGLNVIRVCGVCSKVERLTFNYCDYNAIEMDDFNACIDCNKLVCSDCYVRNIHGDMCCSVCKPLYVTQDTNEPSN